MAVLYLPSPTEAHGRFPDKLGHEEQRLPCTGTGVQMPVTDLTVIMDLALTHLALVLRVRV